MKYGICSWVLPMEQKQCFSFARCMELDGVSIDMVLDNGRAKLLQHHVQLQYQEEVKRHRQQIPALAMNILCEIGMSNKLQFAQVKELFDQAIEIALAMQIPMIQVPSFFQGAVNTEQELEQTMKCLEYGATQVKNTGIKIGHENALGITENKTIIQRMKDKPFVIYFDTQNPVRLGKNLNPVELAEQLFPYIGEVHVKDSHQDETKSLQLGEGSTCFLETMQVLQTKGYGGWYIMESNYQEYQQYSSIIKKDLQILKRITQGITVED